MATTREQLAGVTDAKPLAHPLPFVVRYQDHGHPPPPHLRELMGAVFRGLSPDYETAPKNVARLYPREHGKSQTGAIDTPVWLACRNPNVRILIMSETTGQATDKLRECRDLISRVGPELGVEIREDNKRSLTLERSEDHDVPTFRAAGMDTGVTGGHYDLLVFDDVVSWKTQRTETRRRKSWRQFNDYSQNLGSEGETVSLVLGTRKHPEDIYSRLFQSVGWDTVVRPAIGDWSVVENGEYTLVTEAGARYRPNEIDEMNPRREVVSGVDPDRQVPVLWPERWPLEDLLLQYVASMGSDGEGSLIWKRENQNDPEALQGQVLGEDMLHWATELPDGLEWYAGVDIGVEEDPQKAAANDTDYWAVAVGGHDYSSGITYLADVKRRRGMSLQKGINWVQAKLRPWPQEAGQDGSVARVAVESNQAQRWFVQTARDEGLSFQQSSSSGSKEERVISMSSRFESGKVRLWDPTDSGGSDEKWRSFVNEWARFPTGAHDDRLDAAEIMLRNVGGENITAEDMGFSDLPL